MQAVTQQLFDRVEANPTSCAMRLLLVTEMLGEQSALLLFPLHSLRNMALLAADTPLVAMIDVDLVLSSTLSDEFSGLAGRRGNVSRDSHGTMWLMLHPGGKAKLVELVQHNSMFEPWYLVDRFRNPWYDARIRGYGLDKQQQVGMRSYCGCIGPQAHVHGAPNGIRSAHAA
ncbi:uncharacterized protein HaLaN_26036, partial [Haematococcus lacustris]